MELYQRDPLDPTGLGHDLLNPHDSDGSDDINDIDFSNPESLFSGIGLPQPSSYPTPAEVRQEAFELSTEVLSNWTTLQKILDRHEGTLRKRWMKKTKAQRREILLTAWPDIPSTHRPDFQAFRKEPHQKGPQGTKFKNAYLWPYITVEDLVQAKSLLLFLNSRGRNPPSKFAHADFEASNLGRVSGAIVLPFLITIPCSLKDMKQRLMESLMLGVRMGMLSN
jgi:hypothetical protein